MRGLYAIVDVGVLSRRALDPLWFAEAVLTAHPAALQLRAKELPAREIMSLLRTLAPMCHRAKVPLVANDRADLASFAGCDMVHIGQEDISIDLVRRLAPGLGVGISTHSLEQLQAALNAKPAYAAFGPVYATTTKAGAVAPLGLTALGDAGAKARAANIPLVAIGGITLEVAPEVAWSANAGAVITGLLPAGVVGPARPFDDAFREVAGRARALQAALAPSAPLVEAAGA
jgi:thiamine-phosphate pyrophosphorylase